MHLSSLRLHGFKSFATVTHLHFQPGLTAIVGPNGSGKSNIADAIRWVLGEQSLRALRGTRSQDVIFSGNGQRRPLGFAEVTLQLDNRDGQLPLEFSEISLSRRVYQSGEGEYAINGAACRLRDIHDLLTDSGLGRGGLFVVSQGEVDAVLSGQPEDRRLLIEEVARTAGYRVRKRRALERLEAAAADRRRVHDLLQELRRQEEELAIQAEQAERYRRLTRELHQLERRILALEWAAVYPRWREGRDKLAVLEADLALQEQLLEKEETRYRELLGERDAAEQSFTEASAALQEGERALAESRHRQEMLQLRASRLDQEEEQYREQLQELQEQLREESESRERHLQRLAEVRSEAARLTQEVARMHRLHKGQEEDLEARREALEALRAQMVRAQQEALAHQGALKALEGQQATLVQQMDRWRQELAEVEEEIGHLAEREKRLAEGLQALASERDALEGQYQRLAKEQAEVRRLQEEARKRLNGLEEAQRADAARARALRDMEESQEGYQSGVRAVMRAAQRLAPGIIGPVGQLLEVEAAWQTAIETALGGAIEFIVTQDDRAAKDAIAFLKREKAGRATFLPLNLLRIDEPPPRLRAVLGEPEVVGLASDLVKVKPEAADAVRYLLGRTLVVRTLDAAVEISRRLPASVRIVTPEGDMVSPGGTVSGGAFARDRRRELLRRRQVLLELQRTLEQREAQVAAAKEELLEASRELERVESEIQRVRQRLHQLQAEAQARRGGQGEAEELGQRLLARRLRLERDLEQGQQQDEQIQERMAQTRKAWQEAQARAADLQQELEEQRIRVEEARLALQEAAPELNEAQARLAALQQQETHLEQDVKREEAALARTQRRCLELEERRAQAQAERQRLQEEQEQEEQRSRALQERVDAGRRRLEAAQHAWQAIREQVRTADEELAGRRAEVSRQRQAYHRQETLWQRLDHEMQSLRRRAESLGVPLEEDHPVWEEPGRALLGGGTPGEAAEGDGLSAAAGGSVEAAAADLGLLQRQAARMRRDLEGMANVNLAAPEQLAQIRERIAHLEEQAQDLLGAEEALRQAIAEIDRTSERLFTETLQEIQKAFSEVFRELFSDGEALLTLTDPDHPLSSGVDVHVRLPGKPVRNLLALSGGERALIALALLMAILRVRPVPFCVLDEVDASLDEANLSRFTRLLETTARRTQIIAITHRRQTMEVADCLYGVTMREAGVSTLVSLRLADVS